MSTFNWANPASNTVASIKKEIASLGITPPNNANKNELIQILMDNKNKSPKSKGSPGRPGRKPKSPRSPGKQQPQSEPPKSPAKEEKTYISSRLLLDEEKPKPAAISSPKDNAPKQSPMKSQSPKENVFQQSSPAQQSPKQPTQKQPSPKESSPKENSPKHFTPKVNTPKEPSPFAHMSRPLRSQSPIKGVENKTTSSLDTEKILLYAMIFAFIFSIIMPSVGPVLLIGCFIAWICVKIMKSKKNKNKKQ
ncbi:anti-sigma factor domain-containing protein [Histomonas meleagridis]|uniref:anti-sigma factor domain-containing protein n=1 Tax=Histomonas meleagridis TaxID=135588 RepID=UPI00355A26BA|nr:anti-sigma factor domain-containing protein [Histomonas meleagridis]KAH0802737.1 anti-sigma factor domain-containing protein [Histomonas meleagridis]